MDQSANAAGITPFTAAEHDLLESTIISELERVYAGYDLNFVSQSAAPSEPHETIDFAADLPDFVLGQAPLAAYNFSTERTVSVASDAFGFIVDEFFGTSNRPAQLNQLGTAIAGTAAHELLHSFGTRHSAAYGTDGISHLNYNNTLGLQNQHLIATGSTGLGEFGRETQRVLGTWERAMLDVAGRTGIGGKTLTLNDTNSFNLGEAGDFGEDANTAVDLTAANVFLPGATSGLDLTVLQGTLNATDPADWMSVTVTGPALLSAEVWSLDLFVNDFDSQLEVIDTDGTTVIAANGDNEYSGNTFGSGGNGSEDPFLVNVALPEAGTYFVALSAEELLTQTGVYQITLGIQDVPEPTTAVVLAAACLAAVRRRRVS
ncbi:MAG: PEP-CTERM sorting domain-containing protein [Planctomycetota bacterium]